VERRRLPWSRFFAESEEITFATANDAWYAANIEKVGHYSAMLWKGLQGVGCATYACPGKTYNVHQCVYGGSAFSVTPNSGTDFVNNLPTRLIGNSVSDQKTKQKCCDAMYGPASRAVAASTALAAKSAADAVAAGNAKAAVEKQLAAAETKASKHLADLKAAQKKLEETSCFPGEAEVSVQDGSSMRVDEIELGTTVTAESGFEQVFGMLHLVSEVSHSSAHATTVSV